MLTVSRIRFPVSPLTDAMMYIPGDVNKGSASRNYYSKVCYAYMILPFAVMRSSTLVCIRLTLGILQLPLTVRGARLLVRLISYPLCLRCYDGRRGARRGLAYIMPSSLIPFVFCSQGRSVPPLSDMYDP